MSGRSGRPVDNIWQTFCKIEEGGKVKKAQCQQCNYLQLQTCVDDQLAIFNSSVGISIKFDDT